MFLTPFRTGVCVFGTRRHGCCYVLCNSKSAFIAVLSVSSFLPFSLLTADHIKWTVHLSLSVRFHLSLPLQYGHASVFSFSRFTLIVVVFFWVIVCVCALVGAVKYVRRGTSAVFWCPAERMGEQLSVSEDLDQTLEVLSTFSGRHPCGTQPVLIVLCICSASS